MEDLIKEMEKALNAELYLSSLFLAFSIPDICSAIESSDYKTDSSKYRKWFDKYLVPTNPTKYGIKGQLNANQLWTFRCKFFHQGASSEKSKTGYERLLFAEPKANNFLNIKTLHCVVIGDKTEERSLLININQFSHDLICAYKKWYKEKEEGTNFKKNYERVIKKYPRGIPPVIGIPIIG